MSFAIAVIAVGWIMVSPDASPSVDTVDEAIGQQLLRVVQPVAVESAIMASQEEVRQRDEVLEALRRDLEAARYNAPASAETIRPRRSRKSPGCR